MGYLNRAIVAKAELLQAIRPTLPPVARIAELNQGFALIPVTEDFYDAVGDGRDEKTMGFWFLPGGYDQTLAAWSADGPVSYVEAEYFGGKGEQSAAVWVGGELALGPLHEESAICQALAELGVSKADDTDEFESVGLNRYRDVDHWGSDDSEETS
jgi:hypothetical protein